MADLSLFYWDEGDDFDGGDVLFPGGYDQIIKGLAKGLEIRLEHVVQKIEYDQTGVTLTTNRGVFEAERAVITLPLGRAQARFGRVFAAAAGRQASRHSAAGHGRAQQIVPAFPQSLLG